MVTKNKFIRYLALQYIGVTNMLDLNRVQFITELSSQEIKEIQRNYGAYREQFGLDQAGDLLIRQMIKAIPIDE